ncbi:Flp pilus assembly protein CpaB [Mameliella sediminis]|uniref:Flp pilus assembly protein CpaB n=1 Tax=Mameliella sediminis TaxID=2836866 RepID=UPI001C48027B|nr:Flp pilus assembly protein CpaB [Mameliella sediminis]MBY6116594.1 Flp pilus assembly protein CpaB [Antarctobacter heliothermus]MBY6146347.1 Flp pilus assembly protein CpaB [Mameliella alba]MBV7396687.1 Flp pilus assembly protein CpaB [Mameliella sediminis]MBY6162977.1 Flp pilus assembly protein CpaB [Mameliella alba]MBY6171241.1 Flp pilus assembly protein CpaB [Mameliella alba]
MRLVFGLVLIAGLALAGFAVYMAQNYIGAYENALAQERAKSGASVPVAKIYIAKRAINYGEEIKEEDVALAPWPKKTLPEDYFDEENPFFIDGEGPRLAMRPIEKFEALMKVKVSEPGGDAGLTSRLDRGQRAFAIKVDVASGVSGFLRPGDRVDVYWTGRLPGEVGERAQGEVTKLIQTGIRLIAIDQTANTEYNTATIARTVTVAASPQQVAALAQAQSTGKLSLSLMSQLDDTVAEAIEVDQRSLLGIVAEERVEKQAAKSCTTRVRRGAEVMEIPIPCTN